MSEINKNELLQESEGSESNTNDREQTEECESVTKCDNNDTIWDDNDVDHSILPTSNDLNLKDDDIFDKVIGYYEPSKKQDETKNNAKDDVKVENKVVPTQSQPENKKKNKKNKKPKTPSYEYDEYDEEYDDTYDHYYD